MWLRAIITALFCALFVTGAEAKRVKQGPWSSCQPSSDPIQQPCAYNPNFLAGIKSIKVKMTRDKRVQRRQSSHTHEVARNSVGTQVVAHPAGCPRRAFCGCGAALRVFGEIRRDLWLAANWFKFPRAAPAPGMVAVRRGHVFVLEEHISGNTWKVYDANSGRGLTRIHARSLAGYTIVNPHA